MSRVNGKETVKMTKILVADDYALFREITKRIIAETSDMIVAGEVREARDISDVIDNGDFDIMILDTVISGRSGFDILREVKTRRPFFPVLMLSSYFGDIYERSAFADRADGYVRKDKMSDELVSAIRVIMNGGKYFNHVSDDSLATTVH
ncbi:MAG: hypothetical protein A2Y97_04240 [Nitrospirae bacterium RBG_13_39_12]|nr:MAG: hypothetical protein A2Y97_04240 [Nitrospirae bacterium RBG_13_39_12]